MSLKAACVSPAHMSTTGGVAAKHNRHMHAFIWVYECVCVCVCVFHHMCLYFTTDTLSLFPIPGVGSLCHQLLEWPGRCRSTQQPPDQEERGGYVGTEPLPHTAQPLHGSPWIHRGPHDPLHVNAGLGPGHWVLLLLTAGLPRQPRDTGVESE